MSMSRRLLALPAAAALLIGLSGCLHVQRVETSQPDGIGPLRLTVTLCGGQYNGGPPNETCTNETSGGQGETRQGLVAFRVPAGTPMPDTITGTGPGTPGLALQANPSYTAELMAKAAPPAGEEWHGYASGTHPWSKGPWQFSVEVPLPGDAPFVGPLKARVISGSRLMNGTEPPRDPNSPVVCGNPIDAETPDATRCAVQADWATNSEYPTRDLEIDDAPAVNVPAGQTANLQFPIRFRGSADPSATFPLRTSTTIPGALVTPEHDYTPATDADRTEGISADVPATVAPGDYTVTLRTTRGGETRSGTATVRVTAPVASPTPTPSTTATPEPTAEPVTPERLTLGVSPKRDRSAPYRFTAKGKLTAPASVTTAAACTGTVRVTFKRGKQSVRKQASLNAACRYRASAKIGKAGKVVVSASFRGNASLKAKSAKKRSVRAG